MYLIPQPKSVTVREGNRPLPAFVNGGKYPRPAQTLCDYANRIRPASLFLEDREGAVEFHNDPTLHPGEYRLSIDEDGVRLTCSDETGAFCAVSTLIQLLEPDGTLPCVEIADRPDCPYSSVMVDLARAWHSFELLLRYIDLCRYFKIKVLHLHFTDDQSYTLPSRRFPLLSTPGKTYSFEQIERLRAYASLRGVVLMPEIDVPGHCSSFQKNYAEIFGTGGILPINETSLQGMRELFTELCQLFPESPYIHIGGDEAAVEKWMDNKQDYPYYRTLGVDPETDAPETVQQRIYAHFVNEMATAVFAAGKQPIAWEGFREEVSQYVRKDLIMISWENYYQTTPQLVRSGFQIINCSWQPLYIVHPNHMWSPKEIFEWDVRTWIPTFNKSPYYGTSVRADDAAPVLGAGLCVWCDLIRSYGADRVREGTEDEFAKLRERIAPLAENVWNTEKQRDYLDLAKAQIHNDPKINAVLG